MVYLTKNKILLVSKTSLINNQVQLMNIWQNLFLKIKKQKITYLRKVNKFKIKLICNLVLKNYKILELLKILLKIAQNLRNQ